MPRKKTLDPKAKAKRQKIIAGVGGVLLIGLLAFQIPKTLKMMNQNQNPTPTAASTTAAPPSATNAPLAPPSLDGTAPTAPAGASAAASSGITDPDVAPNPNAGQLVSFGRFSSKDPFAQQVSATCDSDPSASAGSNPCASKTGSTTAKTPSATKSAPTGLTLSPVSTASTTTSTPSAPASALTTATISVDGVSETVKVGASFPVSQPLFVLVSLTRTAAKIGISGGSLETGAQTVILTRGKTLTLMNTADGARYKLRLVATAS